jgi:ribosomal protein L37AE/L43A
MTHIRLPQRHNNNKPNFGFKPSDQYILDKYDNTAANPHTQIFATSSDEEDIEEEGRINRNPQTKKICPSCDAYDLNYIVAGIYTCRSCGMRVEAGRDHEPKPTDREDMFLSYSYKEQRMQQYDVDDPDIPFIAGIPVQYNDDQEQTTNEDNPVQLIRSSPDGRIKHYRCKGLPAEALTIIKNHEDNNS